MNISDADIFTAVMRIPSVTQTTAHVLSDEDFEQVENTIRETIAARSIRFVKPKVINWPVTCDRG